MPSRQTQRLKFPSTSIRLWSPISTFRSEDTRELGAAGRLRLFTDLSEDVGEKGAGYFRSSLGTELCIGACNQIRRQFPEELRWMTGNCFSITFALGAMAEIERNFLARVMAT